jgi:protocatechuate 3,4-dioxygenase alpha subunit
MARQRMGQTPSQTVGPYFGMRLGGEGQHIIAGPGTPGRRLRIEGRVLDADGRFIEDALIEVWQADAAGRYTHPDDWWPDTPSDPSFTGFGRARTDFHTGVFDIETVEPGSVPGPDGRPQAPHLNLIVQARGMLQPSFTRCYLEDAAAANATDPVLARVPEERRATLVATLQASDDTGLRTYRFDIRFGGDAETVFFDF